MDEGTLRPDVDQDARFANAIEIRHKSFACEEFVFALAQTSGRITDDPKQSRDVLSISTVT
jgi:hypothetical protein